MRIVLDTNVLISATLTSGSPNQILKLAEKGLLEIATSAEILQELSEVIKRPKFDPYLLQAGLTSDLALKQLLFLLQIFPTTKQLTVVTADPADNKFLSCAVSAGASFVVTGDKHLLQLKKFEDIQIMKPAQFLTKLSNP